MMAGRSFTRHSNGIGNRIRAEHINELQSALEEDDARIDLKTDDGQFTAHVDDTDNPHNVTKAQLGLGNVDNTSDADKPVSTAQQAALDGKADVEDAVPSGGVYGQVLTVTHSGKQWVDPPGIVYPSLLLSPDGSFDRNGAVSPTVVGDVQVVPGQYGPAWKLSLTANVRQGGMDSRWHTSGLTYLMRMRVTTPMPTNHYVGYFNAGGVFINNSSRRLRAALTGQTASPYSQQQIEIGQWATIGMYMSGLGYGAIVNGVVLDNVELINPSSLTLGSTLHLKTDSNGDSEYESVVVWPYRLPDAEIARITAIPAPWTMANTAVNMALQSQPPATPSGASLLNYFPPNRKIAAGGATLRIAPGASTTAITTLAAGTDVHSTGQTVTASSVSYTLIMTSLGQGFVQTASLI